MEPHDRRQALFQFQFHVSGKTINSDQKDAGTLKYFTWHRLWRPNPNCWDEEANAHKKESFALTREAGNDLPVQAASRLPEDGAGRGSSLRADKDMLTLFWEQGWLSINIKRLKVAFSAVFIITCQFWSILVGKGTQGIALLRVSCRIIQTPARSRGTF